MPRPFITVSNPLFWLNPLWAWRYILAKAVMRERTRVVTDFKRAIFLTEVNMGDHHEHDTTRAEDVVHIHG